MFGLMIALDNCLRFLTCIFSPTSPRSRVSLCNYAKCDRTASKMSLGTSQEHETGQDGAAQFLMSSAQQRLDAALNPGQWCWKE